MVALDESYLIAYGHSELTS